MNVPNKNSIMVEAILLKNERALNSILDKFPVGAT
jgi:hypothetical protein